MQFTLRITRHILVTMLLIAAFLVLTIGLLLRASLPQYDGEAPLSGLSAPVSIDRDALGSVTFKGENRLDLALAMGYVHAQERFFEMDLMRRQAAGELSELFGAASLVHDRKARAFRMRARARDVLQQLPATQLQLLDAYQNGVNRGITALTVRPFPYLLTQTQPAAWRKEDSILVIAAMFFTLNESNIYRELALSSLRAALPESVYRYLNTPAGNWDAPLIDEPITLPKLPSASHINLQAMDKKLFNGNPLAAEQSPGSNSFAVAGALTGGPAIIANDMHLTLRVPNLWFRSRLIYPDAVSADQSHDITGISLPGVPSIVIGSNRHIAWSFTNSHGDFADWVRIKTDQDDQTRYLASTGWQPMKIHHETIRIHNAVDEILQISETEWGPILAQDRDQTPLALAWTALRPEAINLKLIELEHVKSAHQAAKIAPLLGIPVQNFIVGDRHGNISWTLAGRIPIRSGTYDPYIPADWSSADTGWSGWLEPEHYPLINNPTAQRLWSANSRPVSGEWLDLLGNGGYDLGARTTQIRDSLFARNQFTEKDMQAIQLDQRALLLTRWYQLLSNILESADNKLPWVSAMKAALTDWDGQASTDSSAYRIVRAYRYEVTKTVLNGFAAPVRQHDAGFKLPRLSQAEVIVWQLIDHQPQHLLPSLYKSWEELLYLCALHVAEQLEQDGGITERTWGEVNAARIRHPLSQKLPPWVARWLDMPSDPLPGDHNMPRVQSPSFGASQRFVVAPGQEEQGYFNMPGGQSGHPFSPYYGRGHADWVNGNLTPFLPGTIERHMKLISAK
ncbi:penicillin acylase family protein [Nitrosomonas supralitoralis]|uniref:Penicillin acylase family protein n=1 Tax=Nitrosomonas supralitoralis TaxID=2116706 RepID=A0A2P7NV68_9PROT|nr:penicillin acylase family protein [Nitrosomonas supralitoralis]PSJ17338.1 penicillin acylase family protein [Nitrosomonas supralitoralis]